MYHSAFEELLFQQLCDILNRKWRNDFEECLNHHGKKDRDNLCLEHIETIVFRAFTWLAEPKCIEWTNIIEKRDEQQRVECVEELEQEQLRDIRVFIRWQDLMVFDSVKKVCKHFTKCCEDKNRHGIHNVCHHIWTRWSNEWRRVLFPLLLITENLVHDHYDNNNNHETSHHTEPEQ